MTDEYILQHYGVKGMKWGVRRYQNYGGGRMGGISAAGNLAKAAAQVALSEGQRSAQFAGQLAKNYAQRQLNPNTWALRGALAANTVGLKARKAIADKKFERTMDKLNGKPSEKQQKAIDKRAEDILAEKRKDPKIQTLYQKAGEALQKSDYESYGKFLKEADNALAKVSKEAKRQATKELMGGFNQKSSTVEAKMAKDERDLKIYTGVAIFGATMAAASPVIVAGTVAAREALKNLRS